MARKEKYLDIMRPGKDCEIYILYITTLYKL